ncbi:hypothetical protein BpHYR1_001300 [Brachionus plicatilis]|uniref:Uncharacterized protein n=1 Tax=Brachionus plicatilis TaxID=10195 RepID=A0A3M7T7E2_BRAPC|nr:hypothetical protein BpHYR1_001300 [Brachionus plicatilis]
MLRHYGRKLTIAHFTLTISTCLFLHRIIVFVLLHTLLAELGLAGRRGHRGRHCRRQRRRTLRILSAARAKARRLGRRTVPLGRSAALHLRMVHAVEPVLVGIGVRMGRCVVVVGVRLVDVVVVVGSVGTRVWVSGGHGVAHTLRLGRQLVLALALALVLVLVLVLETGPALCLLLFDVGLKLERAFGAGLAEVAEQVDVLLDLLVVGCAAALDHLLETLEAFANVQIVLVYLVNFAAKLKIGAQYFVHVELGVVGVADHLFHLVQVVGGVGEGGELAALGGRLARVLFVVDGGGLWLGVLGVQVAQQDEVLFGVENGPADFVELFVEDARVVRACLVRALVQLFVLELAQRRRRELALDQLVAVVQMKCDRRVARLALTL